MPYSAHVEGELVITPPLNYAEVKRWPEVIRAAGSRNGWAPVKLEQESEVTESDTGTSTVITAAKVVPASDASFSGAGSIATYVPVVVKSYPGHTFSGFFECLGEDGKRWRVGVDSTGAVFEHKPEYIWPEIP